MVKDGPWSRAPQVTWPGSFAGERALGLAPNGISCYYSPGIRKEEIDLVQVTIHPRKAVVGVERR